MTNVQGLKLCRVTWWRRHAQPFEHNSEQGRLSGTMHLYREGHNELRCNANLLLLLTSRVVQGDGQGFG